MLPHRLIVIGASAGGTEPLLELVAGLPCGFPAAICIVTHIPAHSPSRLPEILSNAGPLPASHPHDGEPVRPGRIYCAPPDSHLLVEEGHLAVKRGPRENRNRPAIDALFRSAGYGEGPGAIGVVLSGMLDDGTSGLWTIKRFGGTTIVQDPAEAEYDSMPLSALNQVEVDHVVRARDLAALLVRLAAEPLLKAEGGRVSDHDRRRVEAEISIAMCGHAFRKGVMDFGQVTPQTCPECGGVLVQIREGGFTRYRCHTGHAYTADTLLTSVSEHVEETLWQTMRTLEEATLLLENTGAEYRENGNARLAQAYARRAGEMEARSRAIFDSIVWSKTLSAQRIKHEEEK
ncbi:chemotaxis protein CheB [Deinococcus humi]|uniref:protein-glutamate methylesterase n=1 Tax=Deinococcus humi TaxID=662880 RepID=A0A7W8JTT5_9DEIO|nr:chemotaxis protein CheB [Deinococcus humi]MBB5363117.1 two-component system chemotaxis response regulator CheB [Deinococcus humi]GGO24598.1 protein-glutamate methylesterase [Deinococcus humi]